MKLACYEDIRVTSVKVEENPKVTRSQEGGSNKKTGMPKVNGFCVYMEERRADILAAGHTLQRGRHDLALLVSDDWKALSEEEKGKYNERAKRLNDRPKHQQSPAGRRADEVAKPLAKADDSNALLLDKDRRAMQEARSAVYELFRLKGMESHPLVICSFTVYFEPEFVDVHLPAEIGLTAMTLRDGVIDNFARIIDPGTIPKGHADEVAEAVDKLGIPAPGSVPELVDYKTLMDIVHGFLDKYQGDLGRKEGDFHVFAFDSDYVTVRKCLDWLLLKTGNRFSVKILSLDQFSYVAATRNSQINSTKESLERASGQSIIATISPHRVVGKPLIETFTYPSEFPMTQYGLFISEGDVDKVIKQMDNYKYFDELCCVYHGKSGKNVQNCALNLCNRYAFSILEVLTISNNVKIKAGGHFPKIDEPEERARRDTWIQRWGVTTFEEAMKRCFPGQDETQANNGANEVKGRKNRETIPNVRSLKTKGELKMKNSSATEKAFEERTKSSDIKQKTTTVHFVEGDQAQNATQKRNTEQRTKPPVLYGYGPLEDSHARHPYSGPVPQLFLGRAPGSADLKD